jgi:hypothetical protein
MTQLAACTTHAASPHNREAGIMTDQAEDIRALRAQVDQLTAANAELRAKVSLYSSNHAAAMVDADRREQRALSLLPDCDAHRRELQYLRHCVSWYWESMNVSDQARMAIVGQLGNLVLSIRKGSMPGTVKAADLVTWLEKAIDAQKRPLRRQGYPTLADCIRAGGCEHDGLSDAVKADIAEALGLDSSKATS